MTLSVSVHSLNLSVSVHSSFFHSRNPLSPPLSSPSSPLAKSKALASSQQPATISKVAHGSLHQAPSPSDSPHSPVHTPKSKFHFAQWKFNCLEGEILPKVADAVERALASIPDKDLDREVASYTLSLFEGLTKGNKATLDNICATLLLIDSPKRAPAVTWVRLLLIGVNDGCLRAQIFKESWARPLLSK